MKEIEKNKPSPQKLLNKYAKVINLMQEECEKQGRSFFMFGYLRANDSINKIEMYTTRGMTEIYETDSYYIEKHIKNLLSIQNEE